MRRIILIVDDQEINRRLLAKILGGTYDTLEAADGRQALAVLRTQNSPVSAVLLDLIMPEMDGYEVLHAMGADPALAGIPVIVASQADKTESEGRALALGARDFIGKPYVPEVLLRRLANLIELYESNRCIVRIERDELTGLYTKEAFCRRAAALLESHPDREYMLVATDIERFKLVNESFGTEAGDRLLRYIADELSASVNRVGGLCARHNADHFVTLAPRSADDGHLKTIVSEAEKSLARYDLPMKITLKFGVYPVGKNDVPVDIMCDRAILAAESVKGQYHCVCAYYDDSIRQRLLREQQIIDAMKTALPAGQFSVYLQPKYDLDSERIAGAEALVRWNHPKFGFMNPGEFIPLFEQNGYITELDRFVWEKTAAIIAGWVRRSKKFVPVSVNVSRRDIYQENLPDILMGIVHKHGIRPGQLHLEITETAYTQNPAQLIAVVERLKELGFVIEMDDFGSGYSSLNMLSELPIDVLKLDMRFIQKQANRNASRNILNFIISLAKWMNLLVVAEGVETQEQIDILRNMDCNYVQGFYYARPMPEEEFTQLILGGNLAEPVDAAPREMVEPTTHASSNSRVMLVADCVAADRTVLADYFRDSYTVVEVDNGQAAFDYVQGHFDQIDVILLALDLPVMDGLTLLKKLRASALLQGIPVILTTDGGETREAEAFALGAIDRLVKPYDKEIALHRVQSVSVRNAIQTLEREKRMLTKMKTLAQEAKLDPLTGLYNRMEMENQVQSYFVGNPQGSATFLMLDIDNFKHVNDTYGHDVGDDAIRTTAALLRSQFRQEDVLCRMGGDEFAVFLRTAMAEPSMAQKLHALCEALHFQIQKLHITCSIGACVAPGDGRDYQELYHNADMALLTAKRLGKNRYQIYGGVAELPTNYLYRDMDWLLDEASDAVYICDAKNYTLYYLNNEACQLAGGRDKTQYIGKPCYRALWGRSSPCPYCIRLDAGTPGYSDSEIQPEGTGKSYIIKGKLITWGSREARVQYVQDNTNRAEMARHLREISGDRQLLLDLLPGGVFRYSKREDQFNFVSENMLRMLGYSRAEFDEKFGGHFKDMIWQEDRERVLAEIDEQQGQSRYDSCTYRIEKKDGTLCWVYDSGYLHPTAEGGEYYVVLTDITRQKVVQEENDRLTSLLETMFDNVPGGVCLYHWDGRLFAALQISRQLSDMAGVDMAEELNRKTNPANGNIHPEDAPVLRQAVHAMLDQVAEMDCMFRIADPRKGGWRWLRMQANAKKEAEDDALIYALYTDVTELYQLREALGEQRDMLAAAIEHSGMQSWVYEFTAAKPSRGIPPELARLAAGVGRGGTLALQEMQRYREMLRALRHGKKRATLDVAVTLPGGGKHWLRLMYSVTGSTPDGRPLRAIGTARDVTEEKVTEQKYAEESAYLNVLSASLVASYRINLDTGRVEEAHSRLDMIKDAKLINYTDDYYQALCEKLVPGPAEQQACYATFRPTALRERFTAGKTNVEYEFPAQIPGQPLCWLNLKVRMMCKPGSGELVGFFNFWDVTRERVLRRVVALLEDTEFDTISLLDVASGTAQILHGGGLDEVQQEQKRLRNSAAGVESHLRRHCVPEDVASTVEKTKMPRVVRELETKSIYSVHYRTVRPDGIHYKRADYRYLDDTKNTLLLTIQDFTSIYRDM